MSKDDRRQYKSGSVFQRKDGMWVGRFEAGKDRDGNRRQITVTATTEPAVKTKLEDKKKEIARTGVPEKGSGRKLTVSAWAKTWQEITVNELRPGSYRADASALKVWIIPTIGTKRLENLTPADLRSVTSAQRKAGRGQSSLVRTHTTLVTMLTAAAGEGHFIPPAVFHVKRPKPGEDDRQAIPVDDALKILKVISTRKDASLWAALLLQGLRQGERLGLTWDCVDFDDMSLDISWQLQPLPYIDNKNKHLGFRIPDAYVTRHLYRRFHLVRPKTKKSRRIIPMTTWMADSLRAWQAVAPTSEYGLVWPGDDGLPRIAPDDLAEWKAIQKAAGVEHPAERPYVLHEGRHTTVTLLLNLGVEREVVEAIVGHSKLIEAYDHSNKMPKSRVALEQLAEQLALTT